MNPKLNTIYIISKGRPNCTTAQTLTKMNYPGDWFIVCGNNDETLPEYQRKWGEKVLIFDWYEQIKETDTLDNFGFENMPSGAAPVRNATRRISEERGEIRHWQFDDDYNSFYIKNPKTGRNIRLNGDLFYKYLNKIAEFANNAKLNNVGFALPLESLPSTMLKFGQRVFNAHNLPNDEELFTKWRGRLNDDLINALETHKYGFYEMYFKFMTIQMKETQSEEGGLTDIYKQEGTVRKTAYAVLIAPNNTELTIRYGRYHHKINWRTIIPKIIHEKYKT